MLAIMLATHVTSCTSFLTTSADAWTPCHILLAIMDCKHSCMTSVHSTVECMGTAAGWALKSNISGVSATTAHHLEAVSLPWREDSMMSPMVTLLRPQSMV